ncbi:MAG TPA: DUF4337 domain-containing protein [Tepidisphaeraceae bacterium]|nr:DUF4337 domain-containing protein [Tepidisphaeraceae bacterium]
MSETQTPAPKKTGWEEWATRTTAILAVIAAISSGRWGASNLQAILEQGKVNDTWAFYQAKSMKEHDAQQMSQLAAALTSSSQAPGKTAALQKLEADMKAEASREEKDKLQRQKDAENFQLRRDRLVEGSFWYEISFAALQLGVILCTIAVGARQPLAWKVGIFCGLLGLVVFINGLFGFVHAPKSWYQGVSQEMSYEDKTAGNAAPARSK